MTDCDHRTVVAVPHEDASKLMAMVCAKCHAILYTYSTSDLSEEGASLGDPREDDD